MTHPRSENLPRSSGKDSVVLLKTSAAVTGSLLLSSEEVDRAFGMPIGKLRNRAGIHSLTYAADREDELSLDAQAAFDVLKTSACPAQDLDWIIATSETHHAFPSFSALLHWWLQVRESCGALDVGGACLGLLNAFAVAQAMIGSGQSRTILMVTADVHSRALGPGRVSGEFGGLFGDGASAFLLRGGAVGQSATDYRLGEFFFGCAGQYAAAISVQDAREGRLEVQFDGEALSRAAISRMEKVLAAVELRSGIPRSAVGTFATHQPNLRLVTLLAKQLGVSLETFPPIAQTSGNLGSSTCGAVLHAALCKSLEQTAETRKPIFLASLGPGLVFGGGWLTPVKG